MKNKPDLEHVYLMQLSVNVKAWRRASDFCTLAAGIDQYVETLEIEVMFQRKPLHD